MTIYELLIHNYRSIADQRIRLGDYSLLIGGNNAGKSNCMDALRAFYDELKFEPTRDFPKFTTDDQECWVEIEYLMTTEEAETVRQEYLIGTDRFRVRKWLHPAARAKEGIYGYENGNLSANLFYGWKNVSQGKLGEVVYIPAVSQIEDHTKLTGPSVLRDLLNDILKPIIKSSRLFIDLANQFEQFGKAIKKEQTEDNRSVEGFEQNINKELARWGVSFGIAVEGPKEDDIIKNLIRPSIKDDQLMAAMEPSAFGHGFRRHLIFTIIGTAAAYAAAGPAPKKREFHPEFTLLLFEEPEAFLHPAQQEVMDSSLRELAKQSGRQVLIATHSPLFVSYNTNDLVHLVKVCKIEMRTDVSQITQEELAAIFSANQELIREAIGEGEHDDDDVALEALRHFLWLNPERCTLFFADFVLIVEGLTEQVLVTYLLKTSILRAPLTGVYVLDAAGKYEIPRFMNLLTAFKINHAVMHDKDSTRKHEALNRLVQECQSTYTRGVEVLDKNLEAVLGYPLPDDRWKKASALLLAVQKHRISGEKLASFVERLNKLLNT